MAFKSTRAFIPDLGGLASFDDPWGGDFSCTLRRAEDPEVAEIVSRGEDGDQFQNATKLAFKSQFKSQFSRNGGKGIRRRRKQTKAELADDFADQIVDEMFSQGRESVQEATEFWEKASFVHRLEGWEGNFPYTEPDGSTPYQVTAVNKLRVVGFDGVFIEYADDSFGFFRHKECEVVDGAPVFKEGVKHSEAEIKAVWSLDGNVKGDNGKEVWIEESNGYGDCPASYAFFLWLMDGSEASEEFRREEDARVPENLALTPAGTRNISQA